MYTTESIRGHSLHKNKNKYFNTITNVSSSDANVVDVKRKIENLLKYFYTNLEKSDDIYITPFALAYSSKHLEAMNNHIINYNSSGNISHLQTAASEAGRAVHYFQTPFFSRFASLNKNHLDGFKSEVKSSLEKFNNSIAELQKEESNLSEKYKNIEDRYEKSSANISSAIDDFNTKFDQSQLQRREEFKSKVEEIDSLVEDKEQALDEIITASEERLAAAEKSFSDKIERISRDAEEKHLGIKKLYNIVGDDSSKGAYHQQANIQKESADVLRRAAMVLMVLAIVLVSFPIFRYLLSDSVGQLNWVDVMQRLSLSTLLLIPAFYAARESGRHRVLERRYRMLELQITTLGPYIELLSDDKKKDIREGLVKHFFNNPPEFDSKSQNSDKLSDSMSELKELLERFVPGRV
jgi:hypothetical protein